MPRTYRVAIVGRTGRGNYGHACDTAWLQIPNTEIVGVADDEKSGLAQAARRLKTDRAFLDFRRMLDETRPDILCICQRWIDRHAEMILEAADRGVHVYMEKPFVRTLEEADAAVAACERKNVKLAVAHPTRYSPKLETVRRLIAEGAIGQVLEYRGRGKEDTRGGGQDLWVLGTHVFDMILALSGLPQWCYATVWQQGRPVTRDDVVDGAEGIGPLAGDEVDAMYGLPDGTTAYFGSKARAYGDPSRYGLQIFGTRGVIEILEGPMPPVKYLDDPGWSPGRSGAQWQDVSSAGIGRPEPLTGPEHTSRHGAAIRDLLDAIENDRQPLDNVYVARDVTEMIAAVFESHRLGTRVALPLENRKNPLMLLPAAGAATSRVR